MSAYCQKVIWQPSTGVLTLGPESLCCNALSVTSTEGSEISVPIQGKLSADVALDDLGNVDWRETAAQRGYSTRFRSSASF